MSIEEKALRNSIESHLRGEQPPPEVLAKAPRLEQWAPSIQHGPNGSYYMTIYGFPFGHPRLADRKQSSTGEIVWLDRRCRWARTRNTLWQLGEPEGTEIPIDGLDA